MDFSLSNEQRSWQMAARKFAQDEIGPITQDVGVPSAPEVRFFDVHNHLTAG